MSKDAEYELKVSQQANAIENLENSEGFAIVETAIAKREIEIVKEFCELDSSPNIGEKAIYLAGELKGLRVSQKYREKIKARRKEILD